MSIFNSLQIQDSITIAIAVISILGVAFGMMSYLNNSNKTKTDKTDKEGLIKNLNNFELMQKHLHSKISELEYKIDKLNSSNLEFSADEKSKIISNIQKKILEESVDVFLVNLEEKVKQKVVDKILIENIYSSINRLNREKDSLFKRGNFNLVIGVLISSLGGFMAYFFIQKLPTVGTTMEILSYSFPRISLFILIALLVFFFLNLYKKSLDDIKYFQNEITNMEAKYLSIQLAISISNYDLLSTVLEHFSKTERNFILENGQTTIELEKERISSSNTNSTLELIKDFIKK